MRNTPAEILESETFIVIRRYGFVPDSAGAGKFRGGLGIQLEFQVFAPDATVIARGMDRTRFHPWGVQGGRTGARMLPAVLNPDTDREQSIRKINFLKLVPGDRIAAVDLGPAGDAGLAAVMAIHSSAIPNMSGLMPNSALCRPNAPAPTTA